MRAQGHLEQDCETHQKAGEECDGDELNHGKTPAAYMDQNAPGSNSIHSPLKLLHVRLAFRFEDA
jgi:hypothetical protein